MAINWLDAFPDDPEMVVNVELLFTNDAREEGTEFSRQLAAAEDGPLFSMLKGYEAAFHLLADDVPAARAALSKLAEGPRPGRSSSLLGAIAALSTTSSTPTTSTTATSWSSCSRRSNPDHGRSSSPGWRGSRRGSGAEVARSGQIFFISPSPKILPTVSIPPRGRDRLR